MTGAASDPQQPAPAVAASQQLDLPGPSALQVNDCAFTAERLIHQARREGLRWGYLPLAATGRQWSGPQGQVTRAALGAAWLARLRVRAWQADVVHVHSASVLAHARLAVRRYVVHLHGTDIRTQQYEPRWAKVVREGVRDAQAVFYSTPDLAEHTLPLRSDAHYLPVPVDVARLPQWAPGPRPTVLFASRWQAVKGGDRQLSVAADLVRALAGRADVVGLDWGPDAHLAAAAGVRLVPRVGHTQYLELLAGAHLVVGQSAGILSASELEAMGIGVPVLVPVDLPLYGQAAGDQPPVVAGGAQDPVEAARRALESVGEHDGSAARQWVQRRHGARRAVRQVDAVYRQIMAASNGKTP